MQEFQHCTQRSNAVMQSTGHCKLYTLYTQYMLYTVHTVHTVKWELYTVHTVQIVHTLQCTHCTYSRLGTLNTEFAATLPSTESGKIAVHPYSTIVADKILRIFFYYPIHQRQKLRNKSYINSIVISSSFKPSGLWIPYT